MKKLTHKLTILLLAAMLFVTTGYLQSQVTIGSGIPPTRAALLDLKTQQADATNNATTLQGGLLLPRVELVSLSTLEPFIPLNDEEWTDATKKAALTKSLMGLMVYNVADNGTLYPAMYTWNGTVWQTSAPNDSPSSIKEQPEPFSFYEQGTETVAPLEFKVDGLGTWTYQWYQVLSKNVHVRIGTPIGTAGTVSGTGATTASFTPTGVIKGTTRNANYTGFYKFYCVAKSSQNVTLESAVAEVAVGCGAKNNAGDWFSFMCFNLGAQTGITIQQQMDYNVGSNSSNQHPYVVGEENVWGSLFQWGRIADGHELRSFDGAGGTPTNTIAYGTIATTDIVNGTRCADWNFRPYQQVKRGTTWYGKFICNNNASWTPVAQGTSDQLWLTTRFISNDPCAHYNIDGTYQEFWHDGTDLQNNSAACTDAGTAWRTPSQNEWSDIYKNGTISGHPDAATANTWIWYPGTASNYNRGYEIKPDGQKTTLFLPASGHRDINYGLLYGQGKNGFYWSSSISTTNAYLLNFIEGSIDPANIFSRAQGFSLRCIKNN